MTIALQDLIELFGDNGRRSAIDQLAERLALTERTIVQIEAELEAIDRELEQLGVGFHGVAADEDDEDDDDAFEDEVADVAIARPKAPRKKPAPPGDEPDDNRSSEEYMNALDEVGHELGTTGGVEIRGTDIASAMEKRGFPNRTRVMAFVRAHPNWHGHGDKRARYSYESAPHESNAAVV